jgi:predicted nucleotidyltransferase
MVRTIEAEDGGPPIAIIVDFLMPRDAVIEKNVPPLVENFAVQKADGAALALKFSEAFFLEGVMPKGGKNRIELQIASIPALLAMKGYALAGRMKDKDAYDIYYCVRNYQGGVDALVTDCKPLLDDAEAVIAFKHIAEKFADRDFHGPESVARFAEEAQILEDRTKDQWQTDAYGQVAAWLKGLGLA